MYLASKPGSDHGFTPEGASQRYYCRRCSCCTAPVIRLRLDPLINEILLKITDSADQACLCPTCSKENTYRVYRSWLSSQRALQGD